MHKSSRNGNKDDDNKKVTLIIGGHGVKAL